VANFMMLFVGLAARTAADDAQTQDYNRQWNDYMGELARSGALESGAPFQPDGVAVQHGSATPIELGEVDIGGYALVSAESVEAAVQIAERAPHIALGGTTIIRPCVPTGG
jgi:hypothetical protein